MSVHREENILIKESVKYRLNNTDLLKLKKNIIDTTNADNLISLQICNICVHILFVI